MEDTVIPFAVLGGDFRRARNRPDWFLPWRFGPAARAHQCLLQWGRWWVLAPWKKACHGIILRMDPDKEKRRNVVSHWLCACPKWTLGVALVVVTGIRILVRYLESSHSWWCHQMETFSALLAICAGNSPVKGEFPTHRQVTRSFDDFFDHLNKRLSKQSYGWWLRRHRAHCDVIVIGTHLGIGQCSSTCVQSFINCRDLTTWPGTRILASVMVLDDILRWLAVWAKWIAWHFVKPSFIGDNN